MCLGYIECQTYKAFASAEAASRRRLSRQNSDVGSESSQTPRDYGTLNPIVSNSGSLTPRRRPSAPNRLGSVTSTQSAFEKVKVKGGNSDLRKLAFEAVKQNMEAMSPSVVEGENGGLGVNPETAEVDGNKLERTSSGVTVKETGNGGAENVEAFKEAFETDENAPLLGGKQTMDS